MRCSTAHRAICLFSAGILCISTIAAANGMDTSHGRVSSRAKQIAPGWEKNRQRAKQLLEASKENRVSDDDLAELIKFLTRERDWYTSLVGTGAAKALLDSEHTNADWKAQLIQALKAAAQKNKDWRVREKAQQTLFSTLLKVELDFPLKNGIVNFLARLAETDTDWRNRTQILKFLHSKNFTKSIYATLKETTKESVKNIFINAAKFGDHPAEQDEGIEFLKKHITHFPDDDDAINALFRIAVEDDISKMAHAKRAVRILSNYLRERGGTPHFRERLERVKLQREKAGF